MSNSRTLLILYSSETGSARDVARRVAREAQRYDFMPMITDMDSIQLNHFGTSKYVIFVCSTTGQGDAPSNMKRFWRTIRRRDFPRLPHMQFAVFGLGDSSYPLYNAVARRLKERMVSLGASMLVELGLGDDQHPLGYDGAFTPWVDGLFQELLEWMPIPKVPVDNVDISINSTMPTMTTSNITSDAKTNILTMTEYEKMMTEFVTNDAAARILLEHPLYDTKIISAPQCLKDEFQKQYQYNNIFKNEDGNLLSDGVNSNLDEMFPPVFEDGVGEKSPQFNSFFHSIPLSHQLLSHNNIETTDPIQRPKQGVVQINDRITPADDDKVTQIHPTRKTKIQTQTQPIPETYSQNVRHIVVDLAPSVTIPRLGLGETFLQEAQDQDHEDLDERDSIRQTQEQIQGQEQKHDNAKSFNPTLSNRMPETLVSMAEKHNVYPYEAGDVVCIHPPIVSSVADVMLKMYNLHPLDIITIKYNGYQRQSVDITNPIIPSKTSRINPRDVDDDSKKYYTCLKNTLPFNTIGGDLLKESYLEVLHQHLSVNDDGNSDVPQPQPQRQGDFPDTIFAWELFTWYLNLQSVPKRFFFEILASLSSIPLERERLCDLITPDYAVDLEHYSTRERRTMQEVIFDFPSCRIPLHLLLELIPRIVPRSFSVSSSFQYQHSTIPLLDQIYQSYDSSSGGNNGSSIDMSDSNTTIHSPAHPLLSSLTTNSHASRNVANSSTYFQVHATVAKVEYLTPYKRPKEGLCSAYLTSLIAVKDRRRDATTSTGEITDGNNDRSNNADTNDIYRQSTVWYSFRRATFTPPKETVPSITIGPGTGIASFHSIAQERVWKVLKALVHTTHISLQEKEDLLYNTFQKLFMTEDGVGVGVDVDVDVDEGMINTSNTTPFVNFLSCNLYGDGLTPSYIPMQPYIEDVIQDTVVERDIVDVADSVTGRNYYAESSLQELRQQFQDATITVDQVSNSIGHVTTSKDWVERVSRITQEHTGQALAPMRVIYGCRYSAYDHHYRNFFYFAVSIGAISSYDSVFSRDKIIKRDHNHTGDDRNDNTKKYISLPYLEDKYVQDRLKRGGIARIVFNYLHTPINTSYQQYQKGMFILAGSAKQMPREVRDTVVAIARHYHPDQLEYDDAKIYVERLVDEGRYAVECWS